MNPRGLTSHEVFSFLRPEQVRVLSDHAESVTFTEGHTIYRCGEPAESSYAVLAGKVSLVLPRPDGTNLRIEDVLPGEMFGSCVCLQLDKYALSAIAVMPTTLLKFSASTLKRLMDEDISVGYPLQRRISQTYFHRYLDTVRRLQTVAEALSPSTDG